MIKNYLILFIIFIIILFFLILIACSSKKRKNSKGKTDKIIEYGTPEFKEFVKNAKVKPDEAWHIHCAFLDKKYCNDEYVLSRPLFIVINGDYLFSSDFDKLNNISLRGVYVNSKTGKAIFKENRGYYKLKKIIHSERYIPEHLR